MHHNICSPELWKHEFPLHKILWLEIIFNMEKFRTCDEKCFLFTRWFIVPTDPLEPSFRNNWKIIEFSQWLLHIFACSLIFSYLSSFRTPMWMLFNPNLFILNNYFSILTINDISVGYCMVEYNLVCIIYGRQDTGHSTGLTFWKFNVLS